MTTAPAPGFNDVQLAHLAAKLDLANVSQREGGGGKRLDYIEGWHAIAEANRIFGFDRWSSETVELRNVHSTPLQNMHLCGYMARVRVTVYAGSMVLVREGCGFGNGKDRDHGQSHEKAIKEAETDARKRALMTFGNPFGLALYDKERENVGRDVERDLPDLKSGTALAAMEAGHTAQEAKDTIRDVQAQGKAPASQSTAGSDVDTFPADRKPTPPSAVTQPQTRRPASPPSRNAPRTQVKPTDPGESWKDRERKTRSRETAAKLLDGWTDMRGLRAMFAALKQDQDEISAGLIAQEFEHWGERYRALQRNLTEAADRESVSKGIGMLRSALETLGALGEPGADEPDAELPAERDLRNSYSTKAA